jgi:hypothetical protein
VYALMCYHIALFTEWPITNFTRIWTLTLRYITGISVFSTVIVKLFTESTLVETQRLYFRIYHDRKKNKNSLHLKNCVTDNSVSNDHKCLLYIFLKKTPAFTFMSNLF